jgi:predicted  nucleic acid-binding Zn-ribbon protein
MSETKKITAEQLETLVKSQRELNEVLVNIGIVESQKHSLLHQLAEVNKSLEEFKGELQAEYGSININLEDGSYTQAEENKEVPAKLDVVK